MNPDRSPLPDLHIRSDDALLEKIQEDSFRFFSECCNTGNGLIRDSTQPDSPCSIAVVGFALTAYCVAIERQWMTRDEAISRTLAALRFFDRADQSGAPRGVGYRGFFYHFLHMETGERVWESELSTIDTALLVAGMLTAAEYFDRDDAGEREIRDTAQAIYERVDWAWACNGEATLSMGWTPEQGFLEYRWKGYNEALLLYALALGSPTHPVTQEAYAQWLASYRWRTAYELSYVYAGPLFIHQFSHVWIDFRDIRDAYMARREIDYFENSRRATYVHCRYAEDNPRNFTGYDGRCWGLTACDGPGPLTLTVNGRQRTFFDYRARGAPDGPDDGTVAPWAAIASLPFAPELVMPTIRNLAETLYDEASGYGFLCSFNPTLHQTAGDAGWTSPWHFGLHQGPIVLMIENYRSDFVWQLMRRCPPIINGLRQAGFSGGWLTQAMTQAMTQATTRTSTRKGVE